MKVAVTAVEPQLDAQVDPRFGRCPVFLIVETDDLSFEAVANTNEALGQGAGIQSARLVAERGVKHVLTGSCGPNAFQALTAAGINVIVGCGGSVRGVVEEFVAGRLPSASAPNVPGHMGTGAEADTTPTPAPTPPPVGPGAGPGCGQRRGMGRGRGPGGGRGRGCGPGGMAGGRGRG